MRKFFLALAVIAIEAPAASIPPPPPPADLFHFEVEGIAIECQRRPNETRLRSCRILANEGYVDVQIQRVANDGTYYYWASRVCALNESGQPELAKRTGIVHAGKLFESDLPEAITELLELPLSSECSPAPVSQDGPTSYPFRIEKALIVLDNLWRE